ncbi:Fiber protein [Populus alba x Populus x berolinensis]|uniref:Fiber protein n=1 Tax=Populus alba x Populus x berolinensis TaxID=444605 RepID=A0AAD6R8L0_9ROSI|nr:Fiber protein [Populus alba x Populus x berolinensis]
MENSNDNISTACTTTATTNSIVSVENLNNVANWVSATVVSAFFSSLERFSCVNVSTTDPDDDDDDDDRPLALTTNPHLQHDDVANLPV